MSNFLSDSNQVELLAASIQSALAHNRVACETMKADSEQTFPIKVTDSSTSEDFMSVSHHVLREAILSGIPDLRVIPDHGMTPDESTVMINEDGTLQVVFNAPCDILELDYGAYVQIVITSTVSKNLIMSLLALLRSVGNYK